MTIRPRRQRAPVARLYIEPMVPQTRPSEMETKIVACPRCGIPVEWTAASRYRPFCSERCKMRDLGAWAAEEYRVASAQTDEDAGAAPEKPPQA
jgi:endogenous inhibitor of DNA gyrase (YacG/DUF329 family)